MIEKLKGEPHHRWAFSIARDPKQYPEISIKCAIGALTAWNEPIPDALRDRARELRMYDLIGETAPESPE